MEKRKIKIARKNIYQAINRLHLPDDLVDLRNEFLRIISPSPSFFKRARKWYERVVIYENKMAGAGSHTISELLSVYGHLIDLHERFKEDITQYEQIATEYLKKKGFLKCYGAYVPKHGRWVHTKTPIIYRRSAYIPTPTSNIESFFPSSHPRWSWSEVAGLYHYPTRNKLLHELKSSFLHDLVPGKIPNVKCGSRKICGAIAPHAGYRYSGPIAAHVYSCIAKDGFPETFIIIGPNHTGLGRADISISTRTFSLPLGKVNVDQELAERLMSKLKVSEDSAAHAYECCITAQLQFLQYLKKSFNFVPICMAIQDPQTSKKLGDAIRASIWDKDVVVIASTNVNHYDPLDEARRKSRLAIDAILKLSPELLYKHRNTVCGYGPVAAMLYSFPKGVRAKLLKFATSKDIFPAEDIIVGYAAIVIERSTLSNR